MKWALVRKTFNDSRWLLLACACALILIGWIRVIIVASMQTYRFSRIARHLPEFVQRLSPVPIEDLINYPGLIGFTFEEPITYFLMAVWTIGRASDCVSGELSRGTMEMLLSEPIRRLEYLAVHCLVTVLGVVTLSVAVFVGTWGGIETTHIEVSRPNRTWNLPIFGFSKEPAEGQPRNLVPMNELVKPKLFRAATVNYACLGLFLTGVTTLASACDRYRWRTIGVVVGFYVIETVIEIVGMAFGRLKWMLNLTFFAAYEPISFTVGTWRDGSYEWRFWAPESQGLIPDLGPVGCNTVLLTLAAISFVAAAMIFKHRDLPAPL